MMADLFIQRRSLIQSEKLNNMPDKNLSPQDYTSTYKPTWCPGCGNFGINAAVKNALVTLGIPPHQVVMVFGIGCFGNGSNFYSTYVFHGIHGRTLPAASGIKLANHELTVIADAGDGDGYGEGGNHFIHTCRSNIDITFLVHDNRMYSLTQGQISPTAPRGFLTKSTPFGSLETPFNPLAVALVNGASFVAQGFSGDIPHLTELIKKAINHRGFALVNILQVCVTFNKVNTDQWYKERVYKLEETPHDAKNFGQALTAALKQEEKIPIGVLYQVEKPTYEDELPQIKEKTLVRQSIVNVDISKALEEYK